MVKKRRFLITTLWISICTICCNNKTQDMTASKDSVILTANTMNSEAQTVDVYLSRSKEFSIFSALVKTADLSELLQKPGPFTVFALTNQAFEKLPASKLDEWTNKKDFALNILTHHIVVGSLKSDDLKKIDKLKTLSGEDLKIMIQEKELVLNGKKIVTGDIVCKNGIIHVVDEVFIS